MMIERFVRVHILPGREEDFVGVFQQSQPMITDFEGCHRVRLLRSTENPHIFFTQSLWESEDALNAYRASDFFRATWAKTKPLFEKPAHAWSLEVEEDYL